MKRYVTFLSASVIILIMMGGCGGSHRATRQMDKEINDVPKWYSKPPKDDKKFLYAVSSARSSDREVARQKAVMNATVDLGRKLSQKVEALQKMFNEEVTSGSDNNYDEDFSNAAKTIVNQQLTGVSIDQVKSYARPINDKTAVIETFALVKLPVGQARDIIENTLSRDQELYVRLKASKAFKELQDNIDRLGNDGSQ